VKHKTLDLSTELIRLITKRKEIEGKGSSARREVSPLPEE